MYHDALEWKLHQYRNKSLHGIFPSMFCPFVSRGDKSNNFDVTIARNIFQSSWHSKMASNTSQRHHKNQFLIIWNEKNDFPALSRGDNGHWSVGNLICWYFICHDTDRLFYTFLTLDDVSGTLYVQNLYFFWPNVLFSFFLCLLGTWKSHKMLVKSAIRLPNQFLTNNIVCHGRNQLKMAYFIKLVILIFGCPE